jgi:predicted O-methyltransferase YrrM
MKNADDALLHAEQAAYLLRLEPPRDPLLAEMERYAAAESQPISDPEVASFLAVTARACAARRIVELGTNIGYGAIVLARAAGPTAKVVTVEKSATLVQTARAFIARAGLATQIEVREGTALGLLDELAPGIDLIYIDCVKEEYVAYLEKAVPLLAPHGVIVADNVLWKGHVARDDVPVVEASRTEALRAFNRAFIGHPALRGVILPFGDGVAYGVKQG